MNFLWPSDWSSIFVPDMALLEILLRGTIVYFGILLLFRLVLKRQAGGLGLSDVLLVTLISDASQNSMAGEYRSVPIGLLLVGTLVFWNYAIDRVTFRWPRLRYLFNPRPLVLIRDGQVIQENLNREGISLGELTEQLRLQGLQEPSEVRLALLESEGKVSVIPKEQPQTSSSPQPAPATDSQQEFATALAEFLKAARRLCQSIDWHQAQIEEHRQHIANARQALLRHGVSATMLLDQEENPTRS